MAPPELSHKEFANAGQKAGLQIWRVEKLELVPVPEPLHGNFYVGDAYLVLHTFKRSNATFYNLHYWLGAMQNANRFLQHRDFKDTAAT